MMAVFGFEQVPPHFGHGNGTLVLTKSSGHGPAVMIFGEKGSSKRCSGLGGQPRTIRSYRLHCMMHSVHKEICHKFE
jgi:hypothetical protein